MTSTVVINDPRRGGVVIHHVYSGILIGAEEHSGMVASIVTGNKKFTEEHLAAAEERPDD